MSGISIWWNVGVVLGALLALPLLASALISCITAEANVRLMNRFGERAPMLFGWFGVIVHELSHALMAIIFRHKIDRLKILQNPFKAGNDGRMGYVSHAWNPNSHYQQAGNFFIGLAPIFGISVMMWFLTWLLWPTLFHVLSLHWLVFAGVSWWRILLWLYLCANLILGLNLSRADWQNTRSGLILYAIFLLLVGIVFVIAQVAVSTLLQNLLGPIVIFYVGLLVISFVVYVFAVLVERI